MFKWTTCFVLYLLQLFDVRELYLQDINTGNLSHSSTLWFHMPCHPAPHEQMHLHGSQQEINGLSLLENLVHVG